ncbi:PspA/IM30 family protein [Bacillus alkalicellulosilyticus]|uniref:PspA/IM30 family protein n=1 Tax=Alkalihalobacterium alkalicellulosilyticum TaxID=1912214 RepID=UPI00099638B9|nr:PspA/IM30 family protein [Bacillus alkalicellulosilyticus]
MFQFFRRIRTLVSSELHNMIDKAEDPVKMLDEYLREMEQEIAEVESSTAKIMAEEKLLKRKCEDASKTISIREEQALKALEDSNEELARRVLSDKARLESELAEITTLHGNAVAQVEDLKGKLTEMKSEFQEMKQKRSALITRAQAAKAQSQVNKSLSNMNSEGSKRGFERMEEKILRFEAEAEASEEMRDTSTSFDKELKELDKKSGVDNELERLKEKLAQKNQPKE